jgi:hypothetical protein
MHLTEQRYSDTALGVAPEKSGEAGAPALGNIEQGDNLLRKASKLTQRCNNLPMFEVAGFVQAYLCGELRLGLFNRLGDEPKGGFVISALHPTLRDSGEIFESSRNREHMGSNVDIQEPLMLSSNIKIVEGEDKFIPSVVRFQRFDDKSFSVRDRLYEFGTLVITCDKDIVTLDDREVCVVNKVLAVATGERCGENIQAAPNCIGVSSDLDLERQRQRGFSGVYNEIISGIFWNLFDDHLQVVVEPSIKPRLKGWELGFGPIDRGLSMV